MKDKIKMLLCFTGMIISTQFGWFIRNAEIFNGISLIFGIGFGWYAGKVHTSSIKRRSEE